MPKKLLSSQFRNVLIFTKIEMSDFHVIALIQERYSRFFFCHSPDASGFGLRLVENHSLKKDVPKAFGT